MRHIVPAVEREHVVWAVQQQRVARVLQPVPDADDAAVAVELPQPSYRDLAGQHDGATVPGVEQPGIVDRPYVRDQRYDRCVSPDRASIGEPVPEPDEPIALDRDSCAG